MTYVGVLTMWMLYYYVNKFVAQHRLEGSSNHNFFLSAFVFRSWKDVPWVVGH
jgi:hypothetical protein